MPKQEIECGVLFADIAGSTALYNSLGDEKAQELVSQCLRRLSEVVVSFGGTVIKTIGDEIMCRFETADATVSAAAVMHELLLFSPVTTKTLPKGIKLSVRIGLHYDKMILEAGDLFGDGVNVASRMCQIAKANQIITTAQTVVALTNDYKRSARIFDRVMLKGKTDSMVVYEVIWRDEEDVTRLVTMSMNQSELQYVKLVLHYGDKTVTLTSDMREFVIGRDRSCDLSTTAHLASRIHCAFKYSRSKFVLVDRSTNGTYVRTQEGEEVYLRREELPLWGQGIISFGRPVSKETECLIHFQCS